MYKIIKISKIIQFCLSYDGTVDVAFFGDLSLKRYLSSRLPGLSTAPSGMTDKEIANKFQDLAKLVMKSSQAYFEVTIHAYFDFLP